MNYILIAILGAFLFSGCATVKESEVEPPKQIIKQNTTQYNVSLKKIGDMLTQTNDNDIYFVIGDITNKTLNIGKVPDDITGMLKTAFLNMGYKIHVIRDLNVINNNPEYYKNKELFLVEGEISEFDQVKNSGNGLNIGLSATKGDTTADLDYNNENGTTVFNLSLDLRVLNIKTGEYIPFVFAKNKIRLVKRSKSKSMSFFIFGNGFGISGNYSKQNGMFSSLRLLSELSSVEIVGKLRSLPYWIVLPNGKPDYNVINNFKRQFVYLDKKTKYNYIYFLLGYYYKNLNKQNFNNYIIDIKKRLHIYPVNRKLTPELFAKLLVNVTKYSMEKEVSSKRENLLDSITE